MIYEDHQKLESAYDQILLKEESYNPKKDQDFGNIEIPVTELRQLLNYNDDQRLRRYLKSKIINRDRNSMNTEISNVPV